MLQCVLDGRDGGYADGHLEALFLTDGTQRVLARSSQLVQLQPQEKMQDDRGDTWVRFEEGFPNAMAMPFNNAVVAAINDARMPCRANVRIRDFHGVRLITAFTVTGTASDRRLVSDRRYQAKTKRKRTNRSDDDDLAIGDTVMGGDDAGGEHTAPEVYSRVTTRSAAASASTQEVQRYAQSSQQDEESEYMGDDDYSP